MWLSILAFGFTTVDLEYYGEHRWRPWRYASSGVQGLSGGLNWAVDKNVCGSSCPQLRAALAAAMQVWADHHPLITFHDVSDDCDASGVSVLAHVEPTYLLTDIHAAMHWTFSCPQAEIWFENHASVAQVQLLTLTLDDYTDTSGRTLSASEPELVAGSVMVSYDAVGEQGQVLLLAQQVGHLLGLGHANLARGAGLLPGTDTFEPEPGENYFHALLASGLGLDSSTCVADPWSHVQSGSPDGAAVDPTACINPADGSTFTGCIGVRPALMNHRTLAEAGTVPLCLESDDFEALYTLYPSCSMPSSLPPALFCISPPTTPPPPSSPSPLAPPSPLTPGEVYRVSVTTTMTIAGDADAFDAAAQASFIGSFEAKFPSAQSVRLTISPGSIQVMPRGSYSACGLLLACIQCTK